MTPHDIARELDKELDQLNKRMDLLFDAVNTLREVSALNSDRILNIENALFNLFPKKE